MKKSHFEKNAFKVLTSTLTSWECARTFTHFMVLEFEFFKNILGEDFKRSKELKNAKKIDFFKILKCTSTLKGCDCFTGVPNFILISQAIYDLSEFETLKIGHTHTRAHTHTSGRQLKIKFFDVLDYSDDSDTNISKFFCFTKT